MTEKIKISERPEFDASELLGSEPRFETISRVCAALGVRLVAQPLHPAA